VPDVSLLRWDRIPRAASGRLESRATVPPDLTVEIWSVGRSIRGLTARFEWHVQHRVQIALLVHHRLETIQVMRANLPTTVHRAGERFALDALGPGQEFARGETLEELFDEGAKPSACTSRRWWRMARLSTNGR